MEIRGIGKLVLPVALVVMAVFPRFSSTHAPGIAGIAFQTPRVAETVQLQKEGPHANRNLYPQHTAASLLHEFLGEMQYPFSQASGKKLEFKHARTALVAHLPAPYFSVA